MLRPKEPVCKNRFSLDGLYNLTQSQLFSRAVSFWAARENKSLAPGQMTFMLAQFFRMNGLLQQKIQFWSLEMLLRLPKDPSV